MESNLEPTTRLRVCGYPRSGNHFLMALIWANYEIGEAGKRVETDNLRFMLDNKLSLNPFVRWGKLFGTHHTAEDLHHFYIKARDVVYIIRDPRDVFRSLWFLKYANLLPENFATVERIADWKEHVESFYCSGAIFVRYEELAQDWESALLPVARKFGLQRKGATATGVSPICKVTTGFGPLEIGRVGWFGPLGPTAAAPIFPKHVDDRFAEVLGDSFFDYQLKGLNLA